MTSVKAKTDTLEDLSRVMKVHGITKVSIQFVGYCSVRGGYWSIRDAGDINLRELGSGDTISKAFTASVSKLETEAKAKDA